MELSASAVWKGDVKSGEGRVSTESGMLQDTDYGLSSDRYPEELLGASLAGCYALVLSMILNQKDLEPESIRAEAKVTIEKDNGGYEITKCDVTVRASVPGASKEDFDEAAEAAKQGCPVSKAIKPEITVDAALQD